MRHDDVDRRGTGGGQRLGAGDDGPPDETMSSAIRAGRPAMHVPS